MTEPIMIKAKGDGVQIGTGQSPDPVVIDFPIAYIKAPLPVDDNGVFEQQDLLAESEGLVVQNLVRLYRALGGGWDATAQPMPPEPAPASQP